MVVRRGDFQVVFPAKGLTARIPIMIDYAELIIAQGAN
jgi:hypothetical protein